MAAQLKQFRRLVFMEAPKRAARGCEHRLELREVYFLIRLRVEREFAQHGAQLFAELAQSSIQLALGDLSEIGHYQRFDCPYGFFQKLTHRFTHCIGAGIELERKLSRLRQPGPYFSAGPVR